MPTRDEKQKKHLKDSAIMYEQILKKMPSDLHSIDALINLYEELEDNKNIKNYQKLKEAVLSGEKIEVSSSIIPSRDIKLSITKSDKSSKRKVRLASRPIVSEPIPVQWRTQNPEEVFNTEIEQPEELLDSSGLPDFSVKPQVDFLINLHLVGLLSSKQYAEIMYKLANHKFQKKPKKAMTVVHMLESCKGVDLELIHLYLSKKSFLPFIDIGKFKKTTKLSKELPEHFTYHEGIVTFKKVKSGVCIAFVNPLNAKLMNQLTRFLEEQVYYFITSAIELDKFLKN